MGKYRETMGSTPEDVKFKSFQKQTRVRYAYQIIVKIHTHSHEQLLHHYFGFRESFALESRMRFIWTNSRLARQCTRLNVGWCWINNKNHPTWKHAPERLSTHAFNLWLFNYEYMNKYSIYAMYTCPRGYNRAVLSHFMLSKHKQMTKPRLLYLLCVRGLTRRFVCMCVCVHKLMHAMQIISTRWYSMELQCHCVIGTAICKCIIILLNGLLAAF